MILTILENFKSVTLFGEFPQLVLNPSTGAKDVVKDPLFIIAKAPELGSK